MKLYLKEKDLPAGCADCFLRNNYYGECPFIDDPKYLRNYSGDGLDSFKDTRHEQCPFICI